MFVVCEKCDIQLLWPAEHT